MFLGGLRLRPYIDVVIRLPSVPILALERTAPKQVPTEEAPAAPM